MLHAKVHGARPAKKAIHSPQVALAFVFFSGFFQKFQTDLLKKTSATSTKVIDEYFWISEKYALESKLWKANFANRVTITISAK